MNNVNVENHTLDVPNTTNIFPKITIVTVTYNSGKTLEKTILSVIHQQYPNIEYIIVDGGSTDETISIIKRYESYIFKWISESDRGTFDAMNKGIALASGDIIGIINSDDFYLDKAFIKVILKATRLPDVDIFFGDIVYQIPGRPSFIVHSKWPLNQTSFYSMPIMHPTAFVRRSCYKDYGVFDLTYQLAADHDLMLRFFKAKANFYYLREPIAQMWGGGATGMNYLESLNEVQTILTKHNASLYTLFKFNLNYCRASLLSLIDKWKVTRAVLHHYRVLRDSFRVDSSLTDSRYE